MTDKDKRIAELEAWQSSNSSAQNNVIDGLMAENARMRHDLGRRDNDIGILLANVRGLLEDLGGGIDREDMVIIRQIEADLKSRAASLLSASTEETERPPVKLVPVEPGNIASHAGKAAVLAMPNFIPGYDAEDMAMNMARTVWKAMANALNETTALPSEQTQQTDVERVARAIAKAAMSQVGFECGEDDDVTSWVPLARAALSAMRPSVEEREKIAEIRARHDQIGRKEFPTELELWDAHEDRATLLSLIGGSHDD